MEVIALVLSILFFLVFSIYLFWGIYIFHLNHKAGVNRTFLLLCMSLALWSLGIAMAITSGDVLKALFWRRISAIGWASLPSVNLYFALQLTQRGKAKKGKIRPWVIAIPAFINLYIFSFSNYFTKIQYHLVRTSYGWNNVQVNNIYDWMFNIYFVVFSILSLVIIWKWKKELKDRVLIKQINLVFTGITISVVLGGLTDLGSSLVLKHPLPQVAPLFTLIPMGILYYATKRYGLMGVKYIHKDEIIVTEDEQAKIFKNLAVAFEIGAAIVFVAECMPFDKNAGDLRSAIIKGGTLFALGLGIHLILRIKKDALKEKLIIILLVLGIPTIMLQFLKYAAVTIWAVPIIVIISSLIFSKRTLLITVTVMAIISQRLVWILKPESLVRITGYDYLARIGMYIIAFLIGLYINKIYVAKIKENRYQIAFQKMNSEASFDFMRLNEENFNKKTNRLLEKIGGFFKVERVYLYLLSRDKEEIIHSNEWCLEGLERDQSLLEEIPIEKNYGWLNQLKSNQPVYSEPDADAKSFLLVPVIGEEGIQGFIGIDSISQVKHWLEEDINVLEIIANIIAKGIMKIKTDREIKTRAYYDDLTKLPNHFLFVDQVNRAVDLANQTNHLMSVIFINIDNFKVINNTLGRSGGDILLKQLAQMFTNELGENDTVARFGGDEFLILLNNIKSQKDTNRMANNLMKVFSDSFNIQGQELFVTASAGGAIYPVDGDEAESLIKNANTAMFKARIMGKNRYILCTNEMKEEVQSNMLLSNDLYRALENDEFLVYYQPQVDLKTGKIVGVEALVRWMHPERGLISPGIFIPLAEKNNLINQIGEWVLRTAIGQNKKWQDMGFRHLRMGVNLSAVQFIDPRLADHVEEILEEVGLEAQYLELEITESIAIKVASDVVDILNKLQGKGISIAIDDFGTEYSSLSRLKMFPIDRIKIDMQFVQGIESNEKDRAITDVIINLAKSLELNVLAEGVETEAQLDFLKEKECDYVQGYYYYKPLPAEEMEKILGA